MFIFLLCLVQVCYSFKLNNTLLSYHSQLYVFIPTESAQNAAGIHSGHSQTEGSVPEISFSDLEFGDELGEGASGVVYRGHWKSRDMDVAIKRVPGKINKTEAEDYIVLCNYFLACFHSRF